MNDGLQSLPGTGFTVHQLAHAVALQRSAGVNEVRAKSGSDGWHRQATCGGQLARNGICVNQTGAKPDQQTANRALAAANATG
jgi:hypothetical protein